MYKLRLAVESGKSHKSQFAEVVVILRTVNVWRWDDSQVEILNSQVHRHKLIGKHAYCHQIQTMHTIYYKKNVSKISRNENVSAYLYSKEVYMAEEVMSLCSMLQRTPHAHARVYGSAEYQGIDGQVDFYQTDKGVIVLAEMEGLPVADSDCGNSVFGFHIHEGSKCRGDEQDEFAEVGTHYNPENCPHPSHAGDLSPLFSNKGYAVQMFLTDRFTVEEIIGRTVIVHSGPDDFTTQPAGNAGKKIACGEIRRGIDDF